MKEKDYCLYVLRIIVHAQIEYKQANKHPKNE